MKNSKWMSHIMIDHSVIFNQPSLRINSSKIRYICPSIFLSDFWKYSEKKTYCGKIHLISLRKIARFYR